MIVGIASNKMKPMSFVGQEMNSIGIQLKGNAFVNGVYLESDAFKKDVKIDSELDVEVDTDESKNK